MGKMGESMKAVELAVRQQGSWLIDLVHRLLTTATLWFSKIACILAAPQHQHNPLFPAVEGCDLLSRGLGDYQ